MAAIPIDDLENALGIGEGNPVTKSKEHAEFLRWYSSVNTGSLRKGVREYCECQVELIKRVNNSEINSAESDSEGSSLVQIALISSFATNCVLLLCKVFVAVSTGSMAIIASAADSALDLISGAVLALSESSAKTTNYYEYPVGRRRMEPLGVVIFSSIMGVSSLLVIIESIKAMIEGLGGTPPELTLDLATGLVMGFTVLSKTVLAVFCLSVNRRQPSVSVEAYAQDHFNDIGTNAFGLLALFVASSYKDAWYIDNIAACLIGSLILYTWTQEGRDQMQHIVGKVASPAFHQLITCMIMTHSDKIIEIDTVRCYHFGLGLIVEVDIVLPGTMQVRESHDIAQSLQDKLEEVPEVDRAFVHIDWESDHLPEHKKL